MKKITLFFAFIFIIQPIIFSQPCLPDGITFTTQAQIDSFQINYPNCKEITGKVNFDGEDITNMDSLIVLTSINGNLNIGYWMFQNPSLISLQGLSNLTNVGGSLRIDRNRILVDLSGLENLTSIEGDLTIGTDWAKNRNSITGNPSLKSLKGLDNLTFINGSISIVANDSLSSIEAIEHIQPNSIKSIDISSNDELGICAVTSICNFLASPTGLVYFGENAPGCNGVQEVLDSCDFSSVTDYGLVQSISIYPNLFSSSTTIEYELKQTTNVQISINNHLGERIKVIENKQAQGKQQLVWNAEGLPAGIYFCTLKTSSGTQTMKIIKLK